MRGASINGQYKAGFISAVLLFAAGAVLSQAVAWVMAKPQPQAFIDFLTTPLFSILDVLSAITTLLMLALVVTAPIWAPRP